MQPVRFGILGAGRIAARLVTDQHLAEGAVFTCVASRDLSRAQAFADKWHIPHALDSYEALVAREDVDVVYIATPNPMHCEQAMLAMRAGKHVLCEKPVALNEAELLRMLTCAKQNNVFFMEAMWTRFFPATLQAKQLIADGAIGAVQGMHAQFCFSKPFDPAERQFDLQLGGGALLDVGCYPICFAMDMIGSAPEQVTGVAALGPTGVDEQNTMALRFPGGIVADLSSGVRAARPEVAEIYGSEGMLTVPLFHFATQVLLTKGGKTEVVFDQPYEPEGFRYQVMHVAQCVREGLKESPRMTHADSIACMRVMDELRRQWGLKYPME